MRVYLFLCKYFLIKKNIVFFIYCIRGEKMCRKCFDSCNCRNKCSCRRKCCGLCDNRCDDVLLPLLFFLIRDRNAPFLAHPRFRAPSARRNRLKANFLAHLRFRAPFAPRQPHARSPGYATGILQIPRRQFAALTLCAKESCSSDRGAAAAAAVVGPVTARRLKCSASQYSHTPQEYR